MDNIENKIYEYIQKHQHKNIDSADLSIQFGLGNDIIDAIINLQNKNKIKREFMVGIKYRYVLV